MLAAFIVGFLALLGLGLLLTLAINGIRGAWNDLQETRSERSIANHFESAVKD